MFPERAISHGLSGINKGPVINRQKIRREEDSRSGISEDWSRATILTRMYITFHNPPVMILYTPGTKSHLNCHPRIGNFVVKPLIFLMKSYSFVKSLFHVFQVINFQNYVVAKIMFQRCLEQDCVGFLAINLQPIYCYYSCQRQRHFKSNNVNLGWL